METKQITEHLKAHFLRLYKLAIIDEDFSELELKMLYKFAEQRGISSVDLDKILLNPINTNNLVPETLQDKIESLYDLAVMIWADHKVDENERIALEKYIKMYGFEEENISSIADYFLEMVKEGKTKLDILNEF